MWLELHYASNQMNPATKKSTETILMKAFGEMVNLLDTNHSHHLTMRAVKADEIQETGFSAVMFTIASSVFRLSVLLHFSEKNILEGKFATKDQFDPSRDLVQQNHDYLCELGNNLCGAMTRIIGRCGFSTGMSTPATLQISESTEHMRSLNPGQEAHAGCFMNDEELIYVSLYIFVNKGHEDSLLIEVSDHSSENENSGELEFF